VNICDIVLKASWKAALVISIQSIRLIESSIQIATCVRCLEQIIKLVPQLHDCTYKLTRSAGQCCEIKQVEVAKSTNTHTQVPLLEQ
jgi:hypothetical protein